MDKMNLAKDMEVPEVTKVVFMMTVMLVSFIIHHVSITPESVKQASHS